MKRISAAYCSFIPVILLITAAMVPAEAGGNGCAGSMALLDEIVLDISSWECNFRHSVALGSEGFTEIEEGRVWMEKGGRMRWEYSAPEGKLAVTDGKTAWLYVPDEKRAYKLKIPPQKYLPVPFRLLFGKSRPSKEFFCVSSSSSEGVITVELGLKEKNVKFRRLAVSLDEKGKFITGISYLDEMDNLVSYVFSHCRRNGKIDPGLFSFSPPAGTRVSEEMDDDALGAIEK